MKLPRGLTGAELVRNLQRLGYTVTRQTGSHIRLTCAQPFEHHLTVPNHDPVRWARSARYLTKSPCTRDDP